MSDVTRILLQIESGDPSGLEHLRGLTNLKVLWLRGTKVSDKGLKHLAGLKQLGGSPKDDPEAPGLDLGNTSITDAGLNDLKEFKSLVHLYLKSTQVTADGVKALHVALPQCKLVTDYGLFDPKPTEP